MQEQLISRTQVVLLIFSLRLTFPFLSISTNTPPANQDIWIAQLGSMIYATIFYLPLFYLTKNFPAISMIEYPDRIVGKYLSKPILLLYLGFLSFLSVINTVNINVFIGSSLLPETASFTLLLFMIIPCIYAAYKGIVNIAATGQIIIPIVMAIITGTVILGLDLFDLKVLLPVLKESSLKQVHTGSYTFALCFHDAFLLFMLIPYLQDKKIGKTFFTALLFSTFFLIALSLAPILTLGVELAKHCNYPFYIFAREIKVFDFIERIEALTLIVWLMVELFKISVYLYFGSLLINKIIKTKSHHKFIIPFALMIATISLSSKLYSIEVINKFISYEVFPYISIIFIFLIPFILSVIHFLKKRIGKA